MTTHWGPDDAGHRQPVADFQHGSGRNGAERQERIVSLSADSQQRPTSRRPGDQTVEGRKHAWPHPIVSVNQHQHRGITTVVRSAGRLVAEDSATVGHLDVTRQVPLRSVSALIRVGIVKEPIAHRLSVLSNQGPDGNSRPPRGAIEVPPLVDVFRTNAGRDTAFGHTNVRHLSDGTPVFRFQVIGIQALAPGALADTRPAAFDQIGNHAAGILERQTRKQRVGHCVTQPSHVARFIGKAGMAQIDMIQPLVGRCFRRQGMLLLLGGGFDHEPPVPGHEPAGAPSSPRAAIASFAVDHDVRVGRHDYRGAAPACHPKRAIRFLVSYGDIAKVLARSVEQDRRLVKRRNKNAPPVRSTHNRSLDRSGDRRAGVVPPTDLDVGRNRGNESHFRR